MDSCKRLFNDRTVLKQISFIAIVVALLILRRPQQLIHSAVWDEDGTIIFRHLLDYGYSTFFIPFNGYLNSIAKLINFLSLSVSFSFYPEVSTFLAIVFDTLVVLMVAYSPTVLRWKKVAALFVIVAPFNAEVYLLPLYTFWFAGLLLILAVLWEMQPSSTKWFSARMLFILVGGTSSPLVVILLPLFLARALFLRTKQELATLLLAILVSLPQEAHILKAHAATIPSFSLNEFRTIFNLFFGQLFFNFVGNSFYFWLLTISAVLLICFASYVMMSNRAYKNITLATILLLACIVTAIMASALKVDVKILDPYLAGPRYFFYPYICIGFYLCFLGGTNLNYFYKAIPIVLLLLAVGSGIPRYSRTHSDCQWRHFVSRGLTERNTTINFPIEYDGNADSRWNLPLTNDECSRLYRRAFFDHIHPSKNQHTLIVDDLQ